MPYTHLSAITLISMSKMPIRVANIDCGPITAKLVPHGATCAMASLGLIQLSKEWPKFVALSFAQNRALCADSQTNRLSLAMLTTTIRANGNS